MECEIDSVWASRTTLHARVLMWVGPDRWCMKQYVAIPLEKCELEELRRFFSQDPDEGYSELQDPLFDLPPA